jgi:S-adenosyl-L-methionine hydrolase (adenosine-forming)
VSAPIITFLSDYGYDDAFVGVCHGVIARLCPEARIIDITHGIGRHDVRAGALALRDSLRFMPAAVHLAVIDPEVGAERRAVALRVAGNRVLVGPDNGLLSLAAERLGGVEEAIDVGRSPHRLEPVSATFHGRDIFAPVAARLAAGDPLADAGEPMDISDLSVLELPQAYVDGDVLVSHALTSDRFGNVMLDITHDQLLQFGLKLGSPVKVDVSGRRMPGRFLSTFADAPDGALLLYEDAHHVVALALNRGSAAEDLAIGRDAELRIRSA